MTWRFSAAFALTVVAIAMSVGCHSGFPKGPNAGHGIGQSRPWKSHGVEASAVGAPRHGSRVAASPSEQVGSFADAGLSSVQMASYGQAISAQGMAPTGAPTMVQPASHRHFGSASDSCPSCNGSSSRYIPVYADGEPCSSVPGGYAPTRWVDPQEYVFDGGDRNPKVQVMRDGTVAGLQPEDTVIHFDRATGETLVEPSCRFPVYAPRFGAVRKITSTKESELSQGTIASNVPVASAITREALPPLRLRQPIRAVPEDQVRIVEAFRDRNRGVAVERTIPVLAVETNLLPYADLQVIRTGIQRESEKAMLERGVAAALAWSNIESVQVIIDGKEASILSDAKNAQESVLYDYRGKPCVSICKVGSHQMASPGDEIEFTIRFDNRGVEDVTNVVILDSLPPRLQYVQDSQRGTFNANFSTSPNSAGSDVLRWELQEPLKAGEGGFVIFRCLVR